ncbi:putative methyltransferase-like protein 7A isoform X2 [Bombina bombina]|uniref:putative methyltransferase-like protein 7A isoform X2 n=1 Tax=Bombina bombina TaxID=8345 RepID=UPI00235A996F|nr:putative methyltransferase-like protein 7A isoform X2 [Bombina bombina]
MALHIIFLQICVGLLALPIHILAFLGLWDPVAKKLLPYLLERMTPTYNKHMKEQKRDLFSHLNEFNSALGQLTLLEVGCGTGANFQFYPPGCKVICVDPNPNFKKFLSKSLAENKHVDSRDFVVASGDNMPQVKDASVDVVVCTLVLCSVQDVEGVLAEVLRVLRPGGAFFFLEHVTANPTSWNYFVQVILDPTMKYLGDGCKLTKATWKYLENAKFSELKLRHIQAPFKWNPVRPHIIGYAVK